MNALLHGFTKESFSESARPLSVTVVYEDTDTHRQATAVWEFLVRQLGDNGDLTATWWPTSLLVDPKLAKVAARAGSNSDLILLSLHAQGEPAPALKSWMNSLLIVPSARPGKLVAVLRDRGGDAPINDWVAQLREWARSKNVLLLEGTSSALMEPGSLTERERNIPSSFPAQNLQVQPYLHWGLNE